MQTLSKKAFSSTKAAYICAGARTPIGMFMGKLAKFHAAELGAIALKGALERGGIQPEWVDEVILGNVISAGLG